MRAWLLAALLASGSSPVFVELSSIAFNHQAHQRQHLYTRGRLDVLEPPRYFLLSEGNARVLVLAAAPIDAGDLLRYVGRDLEVGGIVRGIRRKEYLSGVDLDLIEDPTLPPLPAPRADWPNVSLTVLSVTDREAGTGGKAQGPGGRGSAATLLANPPPGAAKAPPSSSWDSSGGGTSSATCRPPASVSPRTGS